MSLRQVGDDEMVAIKVVVTGSAGVGKTKTVGTLKGEAFQELYEETHGVDYSAKDLMIDNERRIMLMIWDTSGKREKVSLTSMFYQGADVIIMMFDITNEYSFTELQFWKKLIQENVYPRIIPSDKQLILIGNKIDKDSSREVQSSRAAVFAEDVGADFIEISAKTGKNVTEVYKLLNIKR